MLPLPKQTNLLMREPEMAIMGAMVCVLYHVGGRPSESSGQLNILIMRAAQKLDFPNLACIEHLLAHRIRISTGVLADGVHSGVFDVLPAILILKVINIHRTTLCRVPLFLFMIVVVTCPCRQPAN